MSNSLELAGFTLAVLRRQFPDAKDYWDGNWLLVTCTCQASGSFVEAKEPFVRVDEIEMLLKLLEELHSGIQTTCKLNCMEPELSLSFETTQHGGIYFVVQLSPNNIEQSHRFRFDIDQSYLPSAINQCRVILQQYPTRDALS
jgi:hypothetical protein